MSAPKQNQNATKDETELASSVLHVRVKPRDKAGWVKAAARSRSKLAAWVTDTLNAAAR